MTNTTREIRLGDRIRENDVRGPKRVLVVQGLLEENGRMHSVLARNEKTMRLSKIKLAYIHTDGKPRKSGWSLVQE